VAELAPSTSARGQAEGPALMAGAPPFPPQSRVTLANWQEPPFNRWAFQHIRELIPTARISRGQGPVWELPRAERDVLGVVFRSQGRELSVADLLAESYTDGFLVLHRGRIVAEHYFNGLAPDVHLQRGVAGGRAVVPDGWVDDTIRGAPDGAEAFLAGDGATGYPPGAHYRNFWWVREPAVPFFQASGINGQNVFVHVPSQTVVAKLSTWPTALSPAVVPTREAVLAIASALQAG
jgi:hypothetical protein